MAGDILGIFTSFLVSNFKFEAIKGKEPSPEKPIYSAVVRPRPYSVRVIQI